MRCRGGPGAVPRAKGARRPRPFPASAPSGAPSLSSSVGNLKQGAGPGRARPGPGAKPCLSPHRGEASDGGAGDPGEAAFDGADALWAKADREAAFALDDGRRLEGGFRGLCPQRGVLADADGRRWRIAYGGEHAARGGP